MKERHSLHVLHAFMLFMSVVAVAQTQQRPVFRGGAVHVAVDVYPRHDGRIVEGLAAEDFQVFEDGRLQSLDSLEYITFAPNTPDAERRDPNTQREGNDLAWDPHHRVFVIYLDHYHVSLDGSYRTRRPVVDFLNRLLQPRDLFGVMTPFLRPTDLILGRQTTTLEEQLTRHWTWGQQPMSIQGHALEPQEAALAACYGWGADTRDNPLLRELVERRREDLVLTQLEALMTYLGGLREARKNLIIFTRGWVLYMPDEGKKHAVLNSRRTRGALPGIGVRPGGQLTTLSAADADPAACNLEVDRLFMLDDQRRMRTLVAAANQHNVTFYPVNPAGLEAPDTMNMSAMEALTLLRDRADAMRTLSANTDGETILDTNSLAAGLRRIADDTSTYYLLGYYSTNRNPDGKFRKIEVKVRQREVKVSARRGYFAPTAEVARAGDTAPNAAAVARSPVDDALGVLGRLRPSSELFTYGVVGDTHLSVVAELSAGQVASGRWAQGADVQVTATTAAGDAVGLARGRIDPPARAALIEVPLGSHPPGTFRVIVRVTGVDSLNDRFDLSPASSGLLGHPLIFRTAPASRAPLRPAADFQFLRSERLHLEWAVRATLDSREARVLGRNGQPLAVSVTLADRDTNGQAILTADLNLAPLAAGDYVLELVVVRGSGTERTFVAFRVT